MQFLGFDIGSSSIKISLIDGRSGVCLASASYPDSELQIDAPQEAWAEQDPDIWWESIKEAMRLIRQSSHFDKSEIGGIGIAYQMHGLVVVDKNHKALRPSIIWCDSRAVDIGDKAFADLGEEECLRKYLNSPGNFTASKLKWIKENEAEIYQQIYKIMLPGDYIAMKLTGVINTTISGLSEGILWDFTENDMAHSLLDYYGISSKMLADQVPTFGFQGELTQEAADELGLQHKTKISYRAGDQPNNALSLNVLQPGEIAATAGTSGVVYGVSNDYKYDLKSRVNTFAHVNHLVENPRLGVLLCINGTGILNSWLKKLTGISTYQEMNSLASASPIGSEGLIVLPFGNGAERILQNKNIGSHILNLDFNRHSRGHIIRAAHEGIAFSFMYGLEIMNKVGIEAKTIRAGKTNMFLSPVFRETLAAISGAKIELYNTNGSIGAAIGAAMGVGYYQTEKEAFAHLKLEESIQIEKNEKYINAYHNWKDALQEYL